MVSSIYYVIFTVCTITASTIMYKDWKNQTVSTHPPHPSRGECLACTSRLATPSSSSRRRLSGTKVLAFLSSYSACMLSMSRRRRSQAAGNTLHPFLCASAFSNDLTLCRNGLRALFGFSDSWRRPHHELGERSRLLAGEDGMEHSSHLIGGIDKGCNVMEDEESCSIPSALSKRRGIIQSLAPATK